MGRYRSGTVPNPQEIGYKDAGVIAVDARPEKYMLVRYNDLQAPMIKAIQGQEKAIQEQHVIIATLLKKLRL